MYGSISLVSKFSFSNFQKGFHEDETLLETATNEFFCRN